MLYLLFPVIPCLYLDLIKSCVYFYCFELGCACLNSHLSIHSFKYFKERDFFFFLKHKYSKTLRDGEISNKTFSNSKTMKPSDKSRYKNEQFSSGRLLEVLLNDVLAKNILAN